MERREQYDPEDIESLLNERSFDELLEEERAYVLRHLTGRDEYEAMRTLLHQVHNDERDREPLAAPPETRAHLLSVFRQQQQPQWQVWLNSVGAMLWPKEMSALWRPALAFGSVALLITAGVFVFRQSDMERAELAEIRPAKNMEVEKRDVPPLDRISADSVQGQGTYLLDGQQSEQKEAQKSPVEPGYIQFTAPSTNELAAAQGASDANTGSSVTDIEFAKEVAAAEAAPLQEKNLATDDASFAREEVVETMSHVVTEQELVSNASTANASGKVRIAARAKTEAWKKEVTGSRSLNDDAALVSLISSGW